MSLNAIMMHFTEAGDRRRPGLVWLWCPPVHVPTVLVAACGDGDDGKSGRTLQDIKYLMTSEETTEYPKFSVTGIYVRGSIRKRNNSVPALTGT